MTTEEIIELAGHRQVPPWVFKLIADCLERYRNNNLPMTFPEREISAAKSCVSGENVPNGKSLWRKRQ